ncbi:bifunctional metallophosphatase/5'-nucleotidase [Pararhodospirillum photometricum]|uniref:5'-Nucleotidase n=1 Tax=Pararhodospirillum photometricum DSM 122 TaxID=1150469 RepID=H6SM40_PARPM|nr:5'-nucleotidase C-terminal domain-containing protein [Pararhodospirillum photometricum]CCG09055.1 5'-Nucleotidase [Pararhodospirillum photometricum DSM 122]
MTGTRRARWGAGLLVVGLLLGGPAWAEGRPSAVLRLLHVNDVYEVDPDAEGAGGLAALKTLVAHERSRPGADQTVVTFGGDLISPSLLSGLDQGAHMLTAMGQVGVEVAVPGNHEFDFGAPVLARLLGSTPFPWLGTNVLGQDGQPFAGMERTALRSVGAYKVGFLGVLTPETTKLSSPGATVRFAPVVETVRETVAALKAQGADVIVALTHQDVADDRALLERVPAIDVIVGGHDHEGIVWSDQGRVILKAGSDAKALGVIDLTLQERPTKTGPVVTTRPDVRLIPNVGQTPDPALAGLIAQWHASLDDALGQPLVTLGVPLDSRRAAVRTQESTMGDLIADALRIGTGADVALVNGGGIRADRLYDAGASLSARDVLTELPFGNVVMVLRLTGAELRAALEHGLSAVEEGAGRFPQVSGLTLTWDRKKPAGSRLVTVAVAGTPLDPAASYTLATTNFTADGGDGYTFGTARPVVDASAGRLMTTLVIDYLKSLGGEVKTLETGRLIPVE